MFKKILALAFVGALIVAGCGPAAQPTIKIGMNNPMTGDIPKVGEGAKYAGQMWLADIEAAGGLEVGGKTYQVELIVEDNESKAESATKAATKLITQDEVLIIVGPHASKQAVPAGEVANNYKTPMISPWSTNPNTTLNRPYVFRGCFLDPFQGPVVANFITEEFGFTKAAVCMTSPATTPRVLLSSSRPRGRTFMAQTPWSHMKASRPRTQTSARS
jgi:branched-chain amino acid transport system substrate-binding protein